MTLKLLPHAAGDLMPATLVYTVKEVDKLQSAEIEGWKKDQKENLRNQCDLHAEIERLKSVPVGKRPLEPDFTKFTAYVDALEKYVDKKERQWEAFEDCDAIDAQAAEIERLQERMDEIVSNDDRIIAIQRDEIERLNAKSVHWKKEWITEAAITDALRAENQKLRDVWY